MWVPARERTERELWTRTSLILGGALGLAFIAADWCNQLAHTALAAGPSDEVAHLLTAVVVLWAARIPFGSRLGCAALTASVAIDLDHIPRLLGAHWLTAGTPRPYTHSLATLALALLVAWSWPRGRKLAAGAGLGLAIHFVRDMAEPGGGVALLWPLSDHGLRIAHLVYLAAMAVALAVGLRRSRTVAHPEPA